MKKNVKKIKDTMKARFQALRNDENGMEAAQVILILALVLLALIPIVRIIISKVSQAGSSASTCLTGPGATGTGAGTTATC